MARIGLLLTNSNLVHRVWVVIRNTVELVQKRSGEATVTTLKTQVLKIDSFTKKMESALRVYISPIKELAYTFS